MVNRIPVKVNNDGKTLINLGSGDWECDGWTNLDYSSKWYSKVQKRHRFVEYDIRHDKIPYEDDSVDCIYCSHVIEHIENGYDEKMLEECYRILKMGGVLRIACPDAEFLWQMAKYGKDWWCWRKRWCIQFGVDYKDLRPVDLLVREVATPRMKNFGYLYGTEKGYKDYIDEFERLRCEDFLGFITSGLEFNVDHVGDHINYWTFEKLSGSLQKAGFKTIIRSRYAGSISPYMKSRAYFDITGRG